MNEFTVQEIVHLIELSNANITKLLNYSSLSNIMNLNQADKRFVKIKKWLILKKIIKNIDVVGNSKIFQLDIPKLWETIPEIKFLKYYQTDFMDKIWGKKPFDYK